MCREGLSGGISLLAKSGTNVDTQLDNRLAQNLGMNRDEQIRLAKEAQINQQNKQDYITESLSTILMFTGALTGGLLGSISTGFGTILISVGASVEAIDSLKDVYKSVLASKQEKADFVSQLSHLQEQLIYAQADSLTYGMADKFTLSGVLDGTEISPKILSDIVALSIEPKSLIDQFAMEQGIDVEMIGDHFPNNIDKNDNDDKRHGDSDINIELGKPWNVVEHYYDEIGACRIHKGSNLIRHNFIASRTEQGIEVRCKDCETTIRNDDLNFLSKAAKIKIWQDDQNKGSGDITLYRIYWRKDRKGDWLPFPGFSYPGKSMKTAEQRLYGPNGHFYHAFRNPRTMIEKTLRNYARTLGIDIRVQENYNDPRLKKIFKIEVLRVIKFQGNWEQIRGIQDQSLREKALHEAKEKTRELANYYEKFFVGFYHSQFPEFGRSKAQGGDFSSLKSFISIDYNKIDNAFEMVKFLSIQNAPYKVLCDLIFPGVDFKSKETTLTHNLEFYFANEIKPFQVEWNKRQDAFIRESFEEGYSSVKIAKMMNEFAQRELSQYYKSPISSWGINLRIREIYKNRGFPENLNPTEIRKIIVKEKLLKFYNDGYTSYNTLFQHFPAFTNLARFKDYIVRNYAGLEGLLQDINQLISTQDFRSVVELIRTYEEDDNQYTHTSLWQVIFETSKPMFFRTFSLTFEEIKVFALTGLLPTRFKDTNLNV